MTDVPPREALERLMNTYHMPGANQKATVNQNLPATRRTEPAQSLAKQLPGDTSNIFLSQNADRHLLEIIVNTYFWFSRKNHEYALAAYKGLREAANKNRLELLDLPFNTLRSLYDYDRALHAASLIHAGEPLKYTELPTTPPGTAPQDFEEFRHALIDAKSLDVDGPFSVISQVTTLLEQQIPDRILQLLFKKGNQYLEYPKILYAIYGPWWYVKIAEWNAI
jgi:hypothetical protein